MCTLTEQDFVRANALHHRPRPITAVLGILVCLVFAVAATSSILRDFRTRHLSSATLLIVAAPLYMAFAFLFWMPYRARRLFRQQKVAHAPASLRFDSVGMESRTSHGHVSIPWSDLHGWKESRHLFLLYHSDALFTPVPKRCFSAEQVLQLRSVLVATLKRTA